MSAFLPKTYIKEEPKDIFSSQINYSFWVRSRVMPYMLPGLASLLLVTQVVYPLISFTTQDKVSKPVAYTALGVASGFGNFTYDELSNQNVLGTNTYTKQTTNIPKYFYLTIPKLGIKEALVETNAETLDPIDALGHYKSSGLPGEVGNTFIYGHSVLPIFFNENNYKTIFSTLHRLEEGDEIFIDYNNKTYKYLVEGKRDLKPQEVYPLATIKPAYLNESTLVLMTCSPAGTKIRRLLVDAILVSGN